MATPRTSAHATVAGRLLRRAVALAADNAAQGQLPFGALVVRAGEVLASGVNTQVADHDPTAHAEIAAIRAACAALGSASLPGTVLVSSCEPCALCHAAAVAAGIGHVVYAAPKELVPPLDGSTAPVDTEILDELQRQLRQMDPGRVVYAPVDGADEPFRRYVDRDG